MPDMGTPFDRSRERVSAATWRSGLAAIAFIALAAVMVDARATEARVQRPAQAAQAKDASGSEASFTEVLTFTNPRFAHKQRAQLKRIATKIKPSPKSSFVLDRVSIDAYVSDNPTEFEREAAATLANDTHRRLMAYGVPKNRIEHATQAQQRAQVAPHTYQIEVAVTGKRSSP